MVVSRKILPAAAALLLVVATTSCFRGGSSAPSGDVGPARTGRHLSTTVDHPAMFTPAQMLGATDGATPVMFGQPERGRLSFGPAGAVIYTPQQGFSGTDRFQVTTSDAVRLYAVDIPPIATVGEVPIQGSCDGSAIEAVPGDSGDIYGLCDRGPSVEGRTVNEKVLPIPDFQPRINRFALADGTATVVDTIPLAGPDGAPLRGLVDARANTVEMMVTVDGAPLPTSEHGVDPEGLVALPDGTFWVSDEYGPFLIHFDANGHELERLSPFDGTLPRELALRSPNQGMVGLTVTPDGTTLVGIMESALATPGLTGSARSVPLTRIITVNLATKAVSEYLYPLADPRSTGVGASAITALSNTTFLINERDGKAAPNASKKIYVADISAATEVGPRSTVPDARYFGEAGGLQLGGKAIETLIGVTTEAAAIEKLKGLGITVASKTLTLDLGALVTELNSRGEFFGHDKIDGLATPDGGRTLMIANDSDFGLAGIESNTSPLELRPKMLPGDRQDTGEILVVDTAQLPARTRTVSVYVNVG